MFLHVVVAPLLLLASQQSSLSEDPMLGLTRETILEMGFDWWFDYYCEEVGASEMSMDIATVTYAKCLDSRNATKLKALPRARAKWIEDVESAFREYRLGAVYSEMALAGGGTMYSHAAARGRYDDEILSENLVALSRSKRRKPSEVEQKEIARLTASVRAYLSSLRADAKRKRPRDSWVRADLLDEESANAKAGFDRLCRLLEVAGPDDALFTLRAADSWVAFGRGEGTR